MTEKQAIHCLASLLPAALSVIQSAAKNMLMKFDQ